MRPFRPLAALVAVVLAAFAACSDPFALPAPVFTNRVDTLFLYAIHGTPIASPSGYRLEDRQAVRTDQTASFDFAFDIDTAGNAVLLSTGALGLVRGSGLQLSATQFDSIRVAPTGGYELDSAVVVQVGSVVLVQSRQTTCSFGLPAAYYAKLQVLDIDATGRSLLFHILVDRNCGYRGLEPGLPGR